MKKSISPLRYPGGKAKMYEQTTELLEKNKLIGETYIEPFAGGCGLALLLLKNGKVDNLVLNDIDRSIFAFWDSVLNRTDELCELIENTEVTLEEREKQKVIQTRKIDIDLLTLGFSTFFLNRVNHSGVIKGGPIGGAKQEGQYKIDCRFNKPQLIKQIREIASYRDKIEFYNLDVLEFINVVLPEKSKESFIFLDPPYYKKGPGLYVNFYKHEDHERLAREIEEKIKQHWIVTYDNVNPIKEMYSNFRQSEFGITYTLKNQGKNSGSEVMVFSHSLKETI
ncbi:MAG: DNA adenine methylase [Cetobacterium sp.]